MKKLRCFSRAGKPIPYSQALTLLASPHYRRVAKSEYLWLSVSTLWNGKAVYYNKKPYIFQSYVHCRKCPLSKVIDGDIFQKEEDAFAGHKRFEEQYLNLGTFIKHFWHYHVPGTYELKRPKITEGRSKKIWPSFTR